MLGINLIVESVIDVDSTKMFGNTCKQATTFYKCVFSSGFYIMMLSSFC